MKTEKKTKALLFRKCVAVLLLLWCTAQTAFAQDVEEYLVVHLRGGEQVSYLLDDRPVVTYDGPQVHVESASLSDDHNMADVEKLTFVKKTDLPAEVSPAETRIIVTPEAVTVQGLPAGTAVAMTDMQGRVLARTCAGEDGQATISTGQFPAGVYIVAADSGRAFKIYKK